MTDLPDPHSLLPAEEASVLRERVRTLEAELQAGQQRAAALFAEAPAPYFLLNSQGRVHEVNAAGCHLLGRPREALLGKRLGQFLAPASQASFDVLRRQVFGSGLQQRGEGQLLDAQGEPFDVLLDLGVARIDGEFGHFRLVVTDITAHKRAHQNLLDRSADQEGQIQAHAARVRALNQELEHVITTLIQQLQLPVSRPMTLLGLLRRALGDPPEEVARPLLNTERAVQGIFTLLASMTRYMNMRRMRVRMQAVDLNRVLREVLRASAPLLADRNVQLSHDPLPTVQGDSQVLFSILEEYLANALKFTKAREVAQIRILARETDAEYHIGVEDNGAGFNNRQKDRLFQLFGRLHPSRIYEGSGVGLVTSRRACERFGGRVWAEGRVDQGATFWFAWPKEPRVLE